MRIDRLVILAILVSCKASAPSSSGSYSEDLSIHRLAAPSQLNGDMDTVLIETKKGDYIPLKGDIKSELDSIAKIDLAQNKEGKFVDGFVIQVYSGTSRDQANSEKYKMDQLYPELSAKISYRQPSFRVQGGKFTDKLEAHRIYKKVKSEFSRAILIPERFLLTYE